MQFNTIQQVGSGLPKKYQEPIILDKTVETKLKIYFPAKKPVFPKSLFFAKLYAFDSKTWLDSTLTKWGKQFGI